MIGLLLAALMSTTASGAVPPERPRLRDLGVAPGIFPPGRLDALTDVAGVRVGHRTLVQGDSVRTGVTVILPHGGNLFQLKTPAGAHVGNGFGKAAGLLQVRELGVIESPIVLTNTLSVGAAMDAVVGWTLEQPGNEEVRSVNAVVGETNDGWLNDIRARRVTASDVRAAIAAAADGPVAEGSVGAGTGTRALGWKGGIGTASRVLPASLGGWTVGALVQSNFGGVLAIDGHPVGKILGRHDFFDAIRPETPPGSRGAAPGAGEGGGPAARHDEAADPVGGGSCMIVLATDAPLSSRNLERLARRGLLGLARAGSYMANGSGDFVVAFSTANLAPHASGSLTRRVEVVEDDAVSPLFLAAVESVEEAVYNSLLRATTVTGQGGHTAEAIPIDRVKEILAGRARP